MLWNFHISGDIYNGTLTNIHNYIADYQCKI